MIESTHFPRLALEPLNTYGPGQFMCPISGHKIVFEDQKFWNFWEFGGQTQETFTTWIEPCWNGSYIFI